MFSQLLPGGLPQVLLDLQHSPYWVRARKLLPLLLGLWIGYFLLVNWFVHKLNRIAIPVLDVPLDTYLTMQGAAVVFAIALFRLARG